MLPIVPVPATSLSARHFPAGSEYGKSYSYKAAACLGTDGISGCTIWSDSLSVEVKPAVPANLGLDGDVSLVTDNEYTLTWNAVDAGTGTYYQLQESSDSGAAWASLFLTTPSSTGHTVTKTGADFEKDYQYQVKACAANDACGDWSSASDTVSLKFGQPGLSVLTAEPRLCGRL